MLKLICSTKIETFLYEITEVRHYSCRFRDKLTHPRSNISFKYFVRKMLRLGAEDLWETAPSRWNFIHSPQLWVGAEQEWHLGDKIPLKERPLVLSHAWSSEITGVINIPSSHPAAGVMPVRAARLCAQTFLALDLGSVTVKM